MSDSEQTVRENLAASDASRMYLAAAESLTAHFGNEEWQDWMTHADLWRNIFSHNQLGVVIRRDAMARTLRQIEALPETP